MCGYSTYASEIWKKKKNTKHFYGGILAGADVTDDTFLEIK